MMLHGTVEGSSKFTAKVQLNIIIIISMSQFAKKFKINFAKKEEKEVFAHVVLCQTTLRHPFPHSFLKFKQIPNKIMKDKKKNVVQKEF